MEGSSSSKRNWMSLAKTRKKDKKSQAEPVEEVPVAEPVEEVSVVAEPVEQAEQVSTVDEPVEQVPTVAEPVEQVPVVAEPAIVALKDGFDEPLNSCTVETPVAAFKVTLLDSPQTVSVGTVEHEEEQELEAPQPSKGFLAGLRRGGLLFFQEVRAVASRSVERLVVVAQPVTSRIDAALQMAQHAKKSVLQSSDAGFVAAAESYEQLKREGVRQFVGAATKSAKGTALEAIKTTRSIAENTKRSLHSTTTDAIQSSRKAVGMATGRAGELSAIARTKVVEVATDSKVHATSAGAVTGAAALGVSGGAVGLVAGGTTGALLGLVPAVFTFGLSIPIGAVMGGSAGLVMGAAAGTTAGAIGGSVAGYGAYAKRKDILSEVSSAVEKGKSVAEGVQVRTHALVGYIGKQASSISSRIGLSSGTGGTDTSE